MTATIKVISQHLASQEAVSVEKVFIEEDLITVVIAIVQEKVIIAMVEVPIKAFHYNNIKKIIHKVNIIN